MATKMTEQEWQAFAMAGTRTGKLAVTRADGRPHVAPVWFALDGGDVMFNTNEATVKGKALRRDPRAAMTIDDQEPPYSFVIIEGTVTLSEDLPEVRKWAAILGGRYMGEDRAEEFGQRNGVPGELLARLHPTKVIAMKDISA
jgi:PPOX class probable F420-dependent enzyme